MGFGTNQPAPVAANRIHVAVAKGFKTALMTPLNNNINNNENFLKTNIHTFSNINNKFVNLGKAREYLDKTNRNKIISNCQIDFIPLENDNIKDKPKKPGLTDTPRVSSPASHYKKLQ